MGFMQPAVPPLETLRLSHMESGLYPILAQWAGQHAGREIGVAQIAHIMRAHMERCGYVSMAQLMTEMRKSPEKTRGVLEVLGRELTPGGQG